MDLAIGVQPEQDVAPTPDLGQPVTAVAPGVSQVAVFRVPRPGGSWDAAGMSAGQLQLILVDAGSPGALIWLLQSWPEDQWYAPGIDGGLPYIPANAAVVAITDAGDPSCVNVFFSSPTNLSQSWMQNVLNSWAPAVNLTDVNGNDVPPLIGLAVTYTPGTSGTAPQPGNPVVYGADGNGSFWTIQWSGSTWTVTSYPIPNLVPGAGAFSLVAPTANTWVLFGEAAVQSFPPSTAAVIDGLAGTWTGTFGQQSSVALVTLGQPTAGAVQWVVGGAVSPGSATTQNSVNPCIFYVDTNNNLMMWPQSLPNDAVVQTPADACLSLPTPTSVTSVSRSAGTAVDLYQVDTNSNVYLLHQMTWVFDNQLPFFAPANLVTGTILLSSPQEAVPDQLLTDIPTVFVVTLLDDPSVGGQGNEFLFEYNGKQGTFNGQALTGQWSGGELRFVADGPPVVVLPSPAPPSAVVGTAYSTTLNAAGGVPAGGAGAKSGYTWALGSGSMPAGWSLSDDGVVSNPSPSPAGSITFEVQATDSVGTTSPSLGLSIAVLEPVAISTATLAPAVSGRTYSVTLVATGGQTPYGWAIVSGAPPVGLTFDSATGVLSGTTLAPAGTTAQFQVSVYDSSGLGLTASSPFTVVVYAPLTVATLSVPSPVVNEQYSVTLAATGGAPPYEWAAASGSDLPAGLTLGAEGTLSGTPASAGTTTLSVEVWDSAGFNAIQALTVTVLDAPPTVAVTTLSLPDAVTGFPYQVPVPGGGKESVKVEAAGGTPPYAWSIPSGALPTGIVFAFGTLQGTCAATPDSTSSFTVQVKDHNGLTATQALSIDVSPLTITPSQLPTATIGQAYSVQLTASGGTAPYTFGLGNETAEWLSCSTDGLLTGTPEGSAATGYSYPTLLVVDADNVRTAVSLTVFVAAAAS